MKQRTSEYRDQSGSVLLYLALNGAIGKRRNRGSIYSPQPTASSILFRDRYSRALAGDKPWRVARTIGSQRFSNGVRTGKPRQGHQQSSLLVSMQIRKPLFPFPWREDGWMDGWMVGRERKIDSVSRVPGHTVFQCAHRGAREANTRTRGGAQAQKRRNGSSSATRATRQ